MDEILEMSREINYSNLVYDFTGPTSSIDFATFRGPIYTCNKLKKGDKTLQQVEKQEKKIKSVLNVITRGLKKSQRQSAIIKNVKNLFDSRQKIIDILNDNSRIRCN